MVNTHAATHHLRKLDLLVWAAASKMQRRYGAPSWDKLLMQQTGHAHCALYGVDKLQHTCRPVGVLWTA